MIKDFGDYIQVLHKPDNSPDAKWSFLARINKADLGTKLKDGLTPSEADLAYLDRIRNYLRDKDDAEARNDALNLAETMARAIKGLEKLDKDTLDILIPQIRAQMNELRKAFPAQG
jgi:hypothetical protein